MAGAGGKLEEGEGASVERVTNGALLPCPTVVESLTVLSANASISSAEDCVILVGPVVVKGSGELRSECAVAREPGPEDWDEELDPFLDNLVERRTR